MKNLVKKLKRRSKKSKQLRSKSRKKLVRSKRNYKNKSGAPKKHLTKKKLIKEPTKICKIMNDHGEIIELPIEYPGDEVVHQDLNPLRHMDIEKFDSDYFKKLYNHYRKICYN
jgi:hypothetical protein